MSIALSCARTLAPFWFSKRSRRRIIVVMRSSIFTGASVCQRALRQSLARVTTSHIVGATTLADAPVFFSRCPAPTTTCSGFSAISACRSSICLTRDRHDDARAALLFAAPRAFAHARLRRSGGAATPIVEVRLATLSAANARARRAASHAVGPVSGWLMRCNIIGAMARARVCLFLTLLSIGQPRRHRQTLSNR